ncbi:hypothetical protein CRM22_004417 [Opisthorchis felineus]|uniref:Uncharacterized protein n=1 Tax=Opisthorchis felineus TaxID=147828 RepID=A0A4S2M1L8_OPIFE|nr:hypothetical protein CRM22_004417 [Opisthorchis felineus]
MTTRSAGTYNPIDLCAPHPYMDSQLVDLQITALKNEHFRRPRNDHFDKACPHGEIGYSSFEPIAQIRNVYLSNRLLLFHFLPPEIQNSTMGAIRNITTQ